MLNLFILLLSSLTLKTLPPMNITYKSILNIPFIGKQKLYLKRLENDKAYLIINGLIKTNGYIYYNKINDSCFEYYLDDNLIEILNKYKVSINDIDYDEKNDVSSVDLKINLLNFQKKIEFTKDENF